MATQPVATQAEPTPAVVNAAVNAEPPPDTGTEGADDRDYEAEAKAQGWTPKEDFRGDPNRWVDAETFVRRADEVMPFLKKQNGHLKREIDDLKKMTRRLMKSEQSAYQNALADIQAKMQEAVEAGDVEAWERLDKKKDSLRDNAARDAETASPDKRAIDKAFTDFRDEHDWYDLGGLPGASDAEKRARAYADREAERMVQEGLADTLAPDSFFAELAERTAKRFPTVNGATPRPKPPSDVAGVTRPNGARNARTGANLPQEAKEHAERYMNAGIFKVKTKAEAYDLMAKSFDWDGWTKRNG